MGNPFVWGQILIHAKYHEWIKKKTGEIECTANRKMSHVSTETVSEPRLTMAAISARTSWCEADQLFHNHVYQEL